MATVYRFEFGGDVDLADVDSAIVLATFASESLHGQAAYLDHGVLFERDERKLVVEALTDSQKDFCRILTGYLRAEFGDDRFDVERPEFDV